MTLDKKRKNQQNMPDMLELTTWERWIEYLKTRPEESNENDRALAKFFFETDAAIAVLRERNEELKLANEIYDRACVKALNERDELRKEVERLKQQRTLCHCDECEYKRMIRREAEQLLQENTK